jgi:hypothetical protein
MEVNTSTVKLLPWQGDFAAGLRAEPETLGVRGSFATGMSASTASPVRHSGDFAAGIRSHLPHLHHSGDFAAGARVGESPASA